MLGLFCLFLIAFVLVWYTCFACVALAMVCDVMCVFVVVGRSCIVVVRFDCFRFGCYVLVVLCAFCYYVFVC